MQPTQRPLQELIGQYSASFDPQRQLIDQQIASNDASGVAQEAGLAAKQSTAFKQIEQRAQDRGTFFSGFSPNAQAEYTADTYLPALAGLQSAIANTRTSLLGNRAGLDTQANNLALQAQESDRNALTAWQQQQAQQAFQAEQSRLDREATAREAAANRSASARSSAASQPTQAQFLSQAFSGYKPAYEGGQAYYTEREIIPAIMANYGISEAQAKTLAYDYRKRVFGEGAGR